MSDTTEVAASGDVSIDALTHSLKWSSQTVTWSLPTAGDQYGTYDFAIEVKGEEEPVPFNESVGLLSPSAKLIAAARAAMAAVEGFTNLDLVELTEDQGDAEIRIAMTTTRKPGANNAYAIQPLDDADPNDARDGDVWLPTDWNPVFGGYDWIITAHELNHALGLNDVNQFDGSKVIVAMADGFQSTEFSIQSYKSHQGSVEQGWFHSAGNSPQSQMMYDIAALQFLYGADYVTNAGNTTYAFSALSGAMSIDGMSQGTPYANIIFRTVWDGGGIDTYDFSDYGAAFALDIDLAPGKWTDVDRNSDWQASELDDGVYARGQLFNALLFEGDTRSLIENATGGDGDDSIRGNQVWNTLRGGDGNDTLRGLDGVDELWGGEGINELDGGNGTDTANFSDIGSAVEVNLAAGIATMQGGGAALISIERIVGSSFNDTIAGTGGNDNLNGGNGSDIIDGGAAGDVLNGDDGNDTLIGGASGDFVLGGSGFDTARFNGPSVTVNLTTGVHTGHAAGDQYASIEAFEGSNVNDTLIGDGAAQSLLGRGGDDRLEGRGGNDVLIGGVGIDTLDGGNGIDRADYAYAAEGIEVNLAAGIALVGPGDADALLSIEQISGSRFDDVVSGDAAANLLLGNDGNDLLDGAGGADTVSGGTGNDTVVGGIGDKVDGYTGTDTLRFLDGFPVTINLKTGVNLGGASNMTITGFEVIQGTSSVDRMTAGSAAIRFEGVAGNDTLAGGVGADTLLGGDGNDDLSGGGGSDSLVGGAGDDVISSGSGFDRIRYALGDGSDTIIGYDRDADTVVLDPASFGASKFDPFAAWLVFGAAAPNADHGWLLMDGDRLLWDADGAGPTAGATTLMTFLRGEAPADFGDFAWA